MNELLNEIHFNEDDLQLIDYEKLSWGLKETRVVEFFPKVFYPVTLISTEIPEFENYLKDLSEDSTKNSSSDQFEESKIAMDLEWEDELCLFQFCSSKRVLIIRHPNGPGNELLQKFLSTHNFFAKGASNDKKQLKLKFGEDFHQNIEDIAQTRLTPYGYSENFMQMTYQFAGKPTADFKDIRITTSRWSQKNLTMRQVLYAAFDVVAIYQCYPNFPPPKILTKPLKQSKNQNQKKSQNNKKKPKNSNNKKSSIDESSTEKTKITMKANYVRSTFCYMVTNYSGSIIRSDLYDLLKNIIDIENINFISSFPEFNSKTEKKKSKNQIEEKLKNEKYKEIEKHHETKKDLCANVSNITDSFTVFISLFNDVDIKKLNEIFPKSSIITKLPFTDPGESSDGDFLYITNIPKSLLDKSIFEKFLHCFEVDHRLKIIENKTAKTLKNEEEEEDETEKFLYARIEVCCASSSHNLKCFVPYVSIDGSHMKLFTFPYFLNSIVAANFPANFNEDDCRKLFSKFGKISSVQTLIRRSDEDSNKFVITYNQLNENEEKNFENDPCENAIKTVNYTEIEGNEILVSKFAEEHHLRMMRCYEIEVVLKESYLTQLNHKNTNSNDSGDEFINSGKLRSIFSKFGEIHQAYFDKRLHVGHVQFYKKTNAFAALNYFNDSQNDSNSSEDFIILSKFDIFFPKEGSTIIVRDVSCSMPQEEIIRMCEMYGRVINFVVRLIIPKFRYQIVEVSYNDVSDAAKAKKELDNKRIDNLPIVVSVFRGAGCEVPMWKMEQRYQWIVVDGIAIEEKKIYSIFERFGNIIDYEIIIQNENSDDKESLLNEDEMQTKTNGNENEKKENQNNDIIVKKSKTMIMFNDSRSAEAVIETFNNNDDSENNEMKENKDLEQFEIRFPTLHEFAFDVKWNKSSLQTEAFVPFKNTVNEAQQLAIVIDPIPPGFSQQWLQKQCPKCFYTLQVTRSTIDPAHGRKAVLFIEGMKMTKKIFALIRNQKCIIDNDDDDEKDKNEIENISTSDENAQISESFSEEDENDGDLLHPLIMSREDALRDGVVMNAEGNDVVHSPISIIIDPLPDELNNAKKIQTNILMGKEADIDIFESASEKGKLMGVILPRFKEDCKVILRKFRRWRVDGLPLNVKKIINNNDDSSSPVV